MAITKIKSSNIEDGTVANVDIADLDSTKLTGTIATARLSNVDLTTLSATNLTSGLIADARVPASAVTQHVTATDLTSVHQGIATLGLHIGVADNKVAFNLPNAFIDTFESDAGIATETAVDRNASEYISTMSTTTNSVVTITAAHQHIGQSGGPNGNATSSAAYDGNTSVDGSSAGSATLAETGIDWTSGVTKTIDGFKASAVHANGLSWGTSTTTFIVYGSTDNSTWVNLGTTGSVSDTPYVEKLSGITTTNPYRYHKVTWTTATDSRISELIWYELLSTANATGTLVSTVQTAPVATTEVSGAILYKDNGSSATTLGTHLQIWFTANLQGTSPNWTGTNWTQASSYGTPQTFSGTTKQVKLGKTTVTSGTQVAMKAVWASQTSGGYETQLHGWAVNY